MVKLFKDKIFAACVLILSLEVFWLYANAGDGSEQIVLRNSLIAEMGVPQDFAWTPDRAPAAFQYDRDHIPDRVAAIVQSIQIDSLDAFDATTKIAQHLLRLRGDGHSVKRDTLTTYSRIVGDGGGYCADYSQVFTALALAAAIPVREWGFSQKNFGGGHAFNEVFSESHRQWIFVDLFSGFYLVSKSDGKLLSVEDLRQALKLNRFDDVVFVRFNPDIFRFRDNQQAWDFYRTGMDQFYLWWGNSIFEYESNFMVSEAGKVSRALEQLVAIVVGVHPRFHVVPDADNEDDWRHLILLRWQLLIVAVTLPCILLILLWRVFIKSRATQGPVGRGGSDGELDE